MCLFLILPLLCSCVAGTGSEKLEKTPKVQLQSHQLFTDDKGKPGNRIEKFDYRQRTLHFRVVLSRPVERAKGRWIFLAKATSAGNGRQIQSVEGEFEGTDLVAQLSLPSDWPVGTYEVQIILDNDPVGSFTYEVTGEKTNIVFLGHSMAPDNGKGLPGNPVESLKPTDRKFHLQVTTKGTDTTSPEVVWRLYFVDGAKLVEVANAEVPRIQLQDSVIKCIFDSPKDWNKGLYRATVSLNGKTAHTLEFRVK